MSAETFIAALARRRATAEVVPPTGVADAALRQVTHWGARRVVLPADATLRASGLADALTATGCEVLTWPVNRDWREILGLDGAPPTCAVTVPTLAVAERGTLVIEGSPTHGRSLDAVGWWHLAVLAQERIVPTLAEALERTYAGRAAPSAVSLVSGPSRTSDIEKISTYGAHGALAEHVIVVRAAVAVAGPTGPATAG